MSTGKKPAAQILPLAEEHHGDAAALVAARYRAQRLSEPLLPAQFEDPAEILPRVARFASKGPGVAALREGRLVGFLVGSTPVFRGVQAAWVPDSCHALAAGEGAILYRELYAALAPQWMARGCISQMVTLYPSDRTAVEAWSSLGFGETVLDSIREIEPTGAPDAEVEIRRAGPGEIEAVLDLERELNRHLRTPPICQPVTLEPDRESRTEWIESPRNAAWLAIQEGEAIGLIAFDPPSQAVLPISGKGTISCAIAYTREGDRREGVARTLLDHALGWAKLQGYRKCAVDFEAANVPGSAFWFAAGFRPVCVSYLRLIDSRLAPS